MAKILKLPLYIKANIILFSVIFTKYFLGFQILFSKLKSMEEIKQNSTYDVKRHAELIKIVENISNLYGINSCLVKSITTFRLMHTEKLKSILHIGVKFEEKQNFQSHAWISSCNKIVNEDISFVNSFKIIKEFKI